MKTRKYTTALLIALSMILTTTMLASEKNIDFKEESYIDDIPFSTEQVVKDIKLRSFNFEEEAYVNDIPFDTKLVVDRYNYKNAVNNEYSFEDEANINDIPFYTKSIATMYIYNQALRVTFNFAEESTVDDIEVNTALIACGNTNAYSCYLSCMN